MDRIPPWLEPRDALQKRNNYDGTHTILEYRWQHTTPNQALEGQDEFDLIAIQEPPIMKTTPPAPPCRRGGRYEMIYHSGRAALYVHKRIDRAAWTAEAGEDWAAATFEFGGGALPLTVWSIYSPNWKRDWSSPVQRLAEREPRGRNVLVGDFNAHHPTWDAHNRTSRTAGALLRLAVEWELELRTPRGIPTRVRKGNRDSTIDHVWATRGSGARWEGTLDLEGSDHRPQIAVVPTQGGCVEAPPRRDTAGRCWTASDVKQRQRTSRYQAAYVQ